jgi:uncharacterized protein YjbI with pentapeptide repeats
MKAVAFATLLSLALGLSAAPALAQNAAQIARVQAGASCAHCNLFQADLGNQVIKNRDFAGSRLRQADFSLSVFNYSNLSGTDLRDVNAYGALFSGANLRGADLTNASFVGAYLEGANLRGAKLGGANFSGAEMDRAVGLTQSQLNRACGDEKTRLPRGLRIPVCQ